MWCPGRGTSTTQAGAVRHPYENPVQSIDYPGLHPVDDSQTTAQITVPAAQLEALFAMTPYYWRTPDGRPAWPSCRS